MFSPVETTDLVQQIARQISDAIVSGRFKPAERLNELRLSQEFGTSRAPVREAARLLESQGLVVSSPRRGFFVRTLSAKDLDDIYELRIGLELHAADLAIQKIGDAELTALEAQIQNLYDLAEAGSIEERISADSSFHRMLCSFSGNDRLLKAFDDLATDMRAGIALIGTIYDDPYRMAETHVPILEALKKKDRQGLREALHFHIAAARDQIVPLFESLNKTP
ncbi:GntR family transcriptional regulator [Roseibium algae]|uniref:GntR family transcriptional regulator n=1 Tax=Roseibium algae TaxID=3123038 RepID=A0ABU8TFE5_9HYPH